MKSATMKKRAKKMKSKRRSDKYKDQFTAWHPGQFMAFDLIDGCFDEGGQAARVLARKSQYEADCFVVNMIINEVCDNKRA